MKKDRFTHILEIIQNILDSVYSVLVPIGELMYIIRDFIAIALMLYAGAFGMPKEGLYVVSLFVFWFCLALRHVHIEYKNLKRKKNSTKRFTYLDRDGNPSIRIEDLPEIVEYLYRLEEENEGITRTHKK